MTPLRACFSSSPRRRSHRDLHSFPTRRSSDLARQFHGRPTRNGRGVVTGCAGREIAAAEKHAGNLSTGTPSYRSESTRLNSSHVSISYAVFCLKKKKKNITKNINDKNIANTIH